jgi:K+-transporting ATPase ATPase C chain
MKIIIKSAFFMLLFTLLLGFIYPFLVWVSGFILFPGQVEGSLVYDEKNKVIGSKLVGQYFTDKKYFWSRPSATGNLPYNGFASGGSNLGPTNEKLLVSIKDNIKKLEDSGLTSPIPPDLVTSSASGLDPHISIKSAIIQVPRISYERNLGQEAIIILVNKNTERRQFGIFGADKVNVLKLNLELDKIKKNE